MIRRKEKNNKLNVKYLKIIDLEVS